MPGCADCDGQTCDPQKCTGTRTPEPAIATTTATTQPSATGTPAAPASTATMPTFGAAQGEAPSGSAFGPVGSGAVSGHPHAGWAVDNDGDAAPMVVDGAVRVMGDSRVYLVQDHRESNWDSHQYVRLDLQVHPHDTIMALPAVFDHHGATCRV